MFSINISTDQVPREECDIVESSTVEEQCGVTPVSLPAQTQCSYSVQETPREMCTSVDMVSFQEVCEQVPRMVPQVSCQTRMKEIGLNPSK